MLAVVILVSGLAIAGRANAGDDQLLGDPGGLRSTLKTEGVDIGVNFIGETFGNPQGGLHQGTIDQGRLSVGLDVDLDKLAAWKGASAHATLYQIYGHGPSANLVGNILDVSGIEALPGPRLFTLWLEQKLFDDRLSVRLGQLAMDDEFMISANSANLVNASFGNPAINYSNMIAGGPVYPVATPGLRLSISPRDDLKLLAAVFSADPGGGNCTEGVQICDPSGTTFSFSGGTLWIAELQYKTALAGLSGTYKLGLWRETGAFADQHFGLDAAGAAVSLAAPNALRPLNHRSDFALYGVADQMLWHQPGTPDLGLSGFLRMGGAMPDRNLVSFYADGGLSWKGLLPDRPDDIALIGVAYARLSPDAARLDQDQAALDPGFPVRNFESVVELSYLAQVRPWLSLQPDLQYIIHPGGNVPNPDSPSTPIRNALLLGVRTTISF